MFNYFVPNQEEFKLQKPFPNFIKKNLWDNDLLLNAEKDFIDFNKWDGQKKFANTMWKKYCGTYDNFPTNVKKIIDIATSKTFVDWLEKVTGIENLLIDEKFLGGGMHETSNGGFLDMHADFNFNKDLAKNFEKNNFDKCADSTKLDFALNQFVNAFFEYERLEKKYPELMKIM
jgi:hypothetical protein